MADQVGGLSPLAPSIMCINVFGGCASQHIWHTFMSLVLWITIMKLLMQYLYFYVNDSFLAQKRGEMLFYKSYKKVLPSNLT